MPQAGCPRRSPRRSRCRAWAGDASPPPPSTCEHHRDQANWAHGSLRSLGMARKHVTRRPARARPGQTVPAVVRKGIWRRDMTAPLKWATRRSTAGITSKERADAHIRCGHTDSGPFLRVSARSFGPRRATCARPCGSPMQSRAGTSYGAGEFADATPRFMDFCRGHVALRAARSTSVRRRHPEQPLR